MYTLKQVVHSIDDTDFSNLTVLFASSLHLPDMKFICVKIIDKDVKLYVNIYYLHIIQ